jgi:hypothetical protein
MPPLASRHRLILSFIALVPCIAYATDTKKPAIAAVFSRVEKNYHRKTNPDGTFKPEYYVMSYGSQVKGSTSDATIDHITFGEFSEVLRQHLAGRNFLVAADPKSADLLLHVNWGRTMPSRTMGHSVATNQLTQSAAAASAAGADGYSSPEERSNAAAANSQFESDLIMMMMEKRVRERANEFNGRLLGYSDEMHRWIGSPALFSAAGNRLDDLRDDIEEARYYILVFAYDLRALVKNNEPKLRWVTRISIRAHGHRFDENLAAMISSASRFFGRDSGGLIRRYDGRVDLGELEVIDYIEDEDAEANTPRAPNQPAKMDEQEQP